MHAAALAEDPSVFDYDSHFDTIQESRAEPKRKQKTARESKYIASLLETAEERKREQDVQYERQLSKERAAEDHLFGDKERFVTAAYKKKLAEEEKWKAEQKEKQEREERNAVEKVGHMGDFYRNILRNNVAFGTATTKEEVKSGGDGGKQEVKRGTDGGQEDDIMPERRAEMSREAAAAAVLKSRVGLLVGEEADQRQRGEGRTTTAAATAAAVPIARENRRDGGGIEATAVVERGSGGVSSEERVKKTVVEGKRDEPRVASQKSREDAVAAAKERYLARKRKAPVDSTR